MCTAVQLYISFPACSFAANKHAPCLTCFRKRFHVSTPSDHRPFHASFPCCLETPAPYALLLVPHCCSCILFWSVAKAFPMSVKSAGSPPWSGCARTEAVLYAFCKAVPLRAPPRTPSISYSWASDIALVSMTSHTRLPSSIHDFTPRHTTARCL
jgi:hypothetical protein